MPSDRPNGAASDQANDFRQRLRRAIDKIGWERAAIVADRSVKQLQRYLQGGDPPLSVVKAIATEAGESLDDLTQIAVPSSVSGLGVADEFVLVPRYDISVSAGAGTLADREHVIDHLAFRRDWVQRTLGLDPTSLALVTATGDSMEPTIRTGDLLLVHTGVDRFLDDAIYVVALGERLLVKRVQCFFNGVVIVKSDNPAYVEQPLSADEAEQAHVAGRVVWIARMV